MKKVTVIMILIILTINVVVTQNIYAQNSSDNNEQIIVKYKNSVSAMASMLEINNIITTTDHTNMPIYLTTNTFLINVQNADKVIDRLKSNDQIEYIHPDYTVKTMDTIPNDYYYRTNSSSTNYQFKQESGINAEKAWDIISTAPDVTVAIIDTGVDLGHEDLRFNIYNNGINTITQKSGVDLGYDNNGHGTHVGGIIGAEGDNGIGSTGVAWNVQLLSAKALDQGGTGNISKIIQAVDYAIYRGARVINASLGGDINKASQAEYDAFKKAIDHGIVVIAAAGNDSSNTDWQPSYPAAYPLRGLISVGASNSYPKRSIWGNNGSAASSYGKTSVHIFAPGSGIISTVLNSNQSSNYSSYSFKSGTSMATPFVAGSIALLISLKPYLTPANIEQMIVNSANVAKTDDQQLHSMAGGVLDLNKLLTFNTNSLYSAPSNFKVDKVNKTNASVILSWNIDKNAQTEIWAKSNHSDDFELLDRVPRGVNNYYDKVNNATKYTYRYYRIRGIKNSVYTPFVQFDRGFAYGGRGLVPEYVVLSYPNKNDKNVNIVRYSTRADTTIFNDTSPQKLVVHNNNITFNKTEIAKTSNLVKVNVRNAGGGSLIFNHTFTENEAFSLDETNTTCSLSTKLQQGESCNLAFTFTPNDYMDYSNAFDIINQNNSRIIQRVELAGSGVTFEEAQNEFSDAYGDNAVSEPDMKSPIAAYFGCTIGSTGDYFIVIFILILMLRSIKLICFNRKIKNNSESTE